jgi:hypothetical protein
LVVQPCSQILLFDEHTRADDDDGEMRLHRALERTDRDVADVRRLLPREQGRAARGCDRRRDEPDHGFFLERR